jgi:DNA-directed RNA polymerase subunit RPC12/RpoP
MNCFKCGKEFQQLSTPGIEQKPIGHLTCPACGGRARTCFKCGEEFEFRGYAGYDGPVLGPVTCDGCVTRGNHYEVWLSACPKSNGGER